MYLNKYLQFQAGEFFFFAGLIGLMAVILAIMSLFYKYVPSSQIQADPPVRQRSADEETMALVDSSAGNYDTSIKTDISEL